MDVFKVNFLNKDSKHCIICENIHDTLIVIWEGMDGLKLICIQPLLWSYWIILKVKCFAFDSQAFSCLKMTVYFKSKNLYS